MNDKDIFTEHYRCKIEPTDRKSYFGPMNIIQVGSGPLPGDELSYDPVVAIYLTEEMLQDLMKTCVDKIKEDQVRRREPRLQKLYTEYITWLNLMR